MRNINLVLGTLAPAFMVLLFACGATDPNHITEQPDPGTYGSEAMRLNPSLETKMQELLRQFPTSTQVDERSISWENGRVMMVLPDIDAATERLETDSEPGPIEAHIQAPLAATVHGCPSGKYCVYEDRSWGGRRLQFSDCSRNDLRDYGFRDKTSSWVNNGPRRVQVKNDRTAWPDEVLWTMSPNSTSRYVGDSNDNKADFFQCP